MSTPPKQYDARVAALLDISADTRILRVEIAGGERLSFQAGQYVFLETAGHDPRAFSIASTPDENILEFHIRSAGHGISAHVTGALTAGASLVLKGPFGANILRDDTRPILAIAGGVGIAPLKAIIETRLKKSPDAAVHLYWGAREEGQLYLDPHFRALAGKHPHFRYTPVLSNAPPGHPARKGFPGQAAAEDLQDFSGFSIYMAGPKPMIDATIPLLLQKGAEQERIFSDAFST